jgi:hypothetical protein
MNAVSEVVRATKFVYPSVSQEAIVLSDIYEEQCNLAVWQRTLDSQFLQQLEKFIKQQGQLNVAKQIGAETIQQDIAHLAMDTPFAARLQTYIGELIDMFCCLFDAKTVGFRISTLHKAMCPRFHVDKVPCRLVTAFLGSGSQWIEHNQVNKACFSLSSNDKGSGLSTNESKIHTLRNGDVAIMKGEMWEGNEGAGLVHRSPPVEKGQTRIVMTLDFVD